MDDTRMPVADQLLARHFSAQKVVVIHRQNVGGRTAAYLVIQHHFIAAGGKAGQVILLKMITHENAAGNGPVLEQPVDVLHIVFVNDGGQQIVTVPVGDVDGIGNVIIEELGAGDGILVPLGGQVQNKQAKDLVLLADQIPGGRVRKIIVFLNDSFDSLAGGLRNIGMAVQHAGYRGSRHVC